MWGPVVSIDVPLERLFSLEGRFSSSRYAYPERDNRRLVLVELADPQNERQSLEAGLYLNFAFEALF
jgi:hypothetical protein